MTSTRTDIHRPTEMDPQNYEYVFCIDNQSPWVLRGGDFALELARKIGRDDELGRGTHQCHHCGAHLRYAAIMRHLPTGKLIVVGDTCLDNRFSLASKADFDRLRKAAQLDRQKQRIVTAATDFIDGLSDTATLALDRNTVLEAAFGLNGWALGTVTDIRAKLWRYGSLSDKQVALVERLSDEARPRADRWAAERAERAAEVKVDAPAGRQAIEGVVVSRKGHDGDFGFSWKLTVKCSTPEGIFLVWLTEPSKGPETERGDLVTVTATLNPSDRDRAFAFGKRPHGLVILSKGNAATEVDSLA